MKLTSRTLFLLLCMLPLAACAAPVTGQEPWMALIAPDNSFNFSFYKNNKAVVQLGLIGWGPNWAFRGMTATGRAKDNELNVAGPFEANGETINVALRGWQSAPNAVSFRYTLTAAKDVPLTQLVATVSTSEAYREGAITATQADGKESKLPLSLAGIGGWPETSKMVFGSKAAGDYTLTLDPPTQITTDNGLRVMLAKDVFPKSTRTVTLTFTFPEAVAFMARDEDLARFTKVLAGPDWYTFNPTNSVRPSALGFEDWLDKPAGKHGGVREVGDHFQFEDGTPVKFWGTNLAYGGSAPEKADADFMAARFAKWGVNGIRMHKFTGAGEAIGDANDATKMDPAGLERLDYFSSQLAKNGVYYGWSHTYHFHVHPGNRDKLLAYDEIDKNLHGDTYGFINIAEDVQDLMIEMVVNLLKHRNPHTGKTYAEDPALSYIELQNEDDIFFYTTDAALKACPTYTKRFTERWCEWLAHKYGTTDKLKAAWGAGLGAGETIEAKNIGLQGNPWFFGEDNLPRQEPGPRRRLLDNAAFLHFAQNSFYGRFAKAIRAAGYKGPLVGSPWQAPAQLPNYYNLRSDAFMGYVDRHNYFGDKLQDTMLKQPGSGYFSSGLQQVAGHPFGMSEWIHVYPALYSAEGPAILAAYGMGLQGWDASYEFQSSSGPLAFGKTVGNFPWGVWNADVPSQIGQYPLLARMIQRGDVKPGDIISVRRVISSELEEGKFSFSDKVTQNGDVKSFGGSVPESALAAGRCLVEFTDKPQPSTFADMSRYTQGGSIKSSTGELLWNTADQGYFTINTRGTKAVVGFAADKNLTLGNVRLKLSSPYASLFVTAADRKADLAHTRRALISAIARNANSGFTYFVPDQRVIDNGKEPVMLEPVQAAITITNRPITAVNVLDQDGNRTGRTLPVANGGFTIDTGRDKTPYYEVVFAP